MDRIVAGMEGTPMVDGKSKSLVAYHEVGHAVCATLTPGHDPVQKVCWRGCAVGRLALVLIRVHRCLSVSEMFIQSAKAAVSTKSVRTRNWVFCRRR